MKSRIEYDNPNTLEEAMRKANFCFEQNRKKESLANWKAKKNNNQFEQKKKDFVPNRNFKNNKDKTILITIISKEIGTIHPTIKITLKVRKLQIIMETLPRTLTTKSLSSVGSVMAPTILHSVLIKRRLLAIYIPYRRR